ncbi:hypothetical protein GCM10025868_36380 [Angustibacter aerolatus]|uniref:Orotate phosphoribosyltransferase-like domain-containing protein n=1 Tax=Angustibacter aerolatus TaxID=1162965 RepID=A0ABQ6JK63_9ACTN|nr:hypothetical protein GCM10025868_36380 [Angustibacter aerolatus]
MALTTEQVASAAPAATRRGAPWSGTWVQQRLGVQAHDASVPDAVGVGDGGPRAAGDEPAPPGLHDLVGLALRRNPRRAHLLVSTVLGKHVPTDPSLVLGAGLLLGERVADLLAGADGADLRPLAAGLASALHGDRGADAVVAACRARSAARGPAAAGTLVLGYAETATGLGHAVATALGATVLHSTRRAVPGAASGPGFEEEHSHATSHLLLPADPALLHGSGPLVLVDDEPVDRPHGAQHAHRAARRGAPPSLRRRRAGRRARAERHGAARRPGRRAWVCPSTWCRSPAAP